MPDHTVATAGTTFEKRIPLLADLDENLYLRNPDPMLEENAVESEPKEALLQEVQTKTKTSAAKHGYLHVRGLGLKKQVGPGEKGKKERWSRAFFVKPTPSRNFVLLSVQCGVILPLGLCLERGSY